MAVTTIAVETHDPAGLLDAVTCALRAGKTTWLTEGGKRRVMIAPAPEGGQPATPDLEAAARAAVPALVLLGDFIGNTFNGKPGIPAFDRCAVLLALRQALADAESIPGKAGEAGDYPDQGGDEPARPGEDIASHRRAAAVLTSAGVAAGEVAAVLRRAYGHLSASWYWPGTDALGHVTYDRGTGQYSVTLPPGIQHQAAQPAPVGYTVSFEYTVDEVTGPREAAMQAYSILTDPQSMRPIATVTSPDGTRAEIDLHAEEY